MQLLEVVKYPDQRLKQKCKAISAVDDRLRELAENMLHTMYHYKGIGLAAPQVGESIRLLVVDTVWHRKPEDNEQNPLTDLEKKYQQPLVLFNPEIIKKESKTSYTEGCLSLPGYFEEVMRSQYIELKALDKSGASIEIKTDGLLAVCLQHELDHLDGHVFIDRLSLIKAERIKAKIKKYGYPERKRSDEGHEAL